GSRALLDEIGVSPEDELWVAGSTAEGEEPAVLSAFRGLPPPDSRKRKLVIAPRRPERFESVAKMLAESGVKWRRRSQHGSTIQDPSSVSTAASIEAEVILLDTIGELA